MKTHNSSIMSIWGAPARSWPRRRIWRALHLAARALSASDRCAPLRLPADLLRDRVFRCFPPFAKQPRSPPQ